jgi:hypothetical protein
MSQSNLDQLSDELKSLYSDYGRMFNYVSGCGSRGDMYLEPIASKINRVRALLGQGPDRTLPKAPDNGSYDIGAGVAAHRMGTK